MFLNLGHALKYDERWAEAKGRMSPDHFCPERWLSEEGQKTGAFLPFGSGLRMCVGYLLAQAEMKVSQDLHAFLMGISACSTMRCYQLKMTSPAVPSAHWQRPMHVCGLSACPGRTDSALGLMDAISAHGDKSHSYALIFHLASSLSSDAASCPNCHG